MIEPTLTLAWYMEDSSARHRPYFAQFVDSYVIDVVKTQIGVNDIVNSKDKWFNDIPLQRWDALYGLQSQRGYSNTNPIRGPLGYYFARTDNHKKITSTGGIVSLSTVVCIAKEAANQIKEQHLETAT